MGSVFNNPQLAPRKTFVPQLNRHEEVMQKQVCSYLRLKYPKVIFRSDYAGSALSKTRRGVMKSMQSGRAFPDLFIYHPMKVLQEDGTYKQFAGCALELKKEGTTIIVKIGSRKGQLVSDSHIQEQYYMLQGLRKVGYFAEFGIGYDETIKMIDIYMGQPPLEVQSMF